MYICTVLQLLDDMSFCVDFTSKKQLDPMVILRTIVGKGLKIMAVSKEFPCMRFGLIDESLRGIEVNKEDDGYEVRINSCSSWGDYYLFDLTINVLQELCGVRGISEDGDPIDDAFAVFDDEWISRDMTSNWDTICSLVRYGGSTFSMYGMFLPFCVGPRMLLSKGISLYPPYEDNREAYDWLVNYFTTIQWSLANGKSTSSHLAIPISGVPEQEYPGISLICIKDGKLNPFDYIVYAPLIGIFDLDSKKNVLMRFNDLKKAINATDVSINSLAGIDECQLRVCGRNLDDDSENGNCGGSPDIDEIRHIMDFAIRYVPSDVTYRPTYPGSGYDEKQNTIVFFWDPEKRKMTEEEYIDSLKNFYTEPFHQQVHEWQKVRMDDRFYLVKVGGKSKGLVMAGIVGSQPFLSSNDSGKGRRQHFVELKPTMMLNPQTLPMMTIEELEDAVPGFMWRGGHSGRMLTPEQAASLETAYANYLQKLNYKDDGVNLCKISRM